MFELPSPCNATFAVENSDQTVLLKFLNIVLFYWGKDTENVFYPSDKILNVYDSVVACKYNIEEWISRAYSSC